SAYNSFIGEAYENIVYERLLRYAAKNEYITKFILKGPHQNKKLDLKKGLLIDRNAQIVYKSGYKDVNEFDGLFFTNEAVYFVESTIVKLTTGLRKRLRKKKALLEVLFPKLQVKALIILCEGATGVRVFPSYCTIWLTKNYDPTQLLDQLINKKNTAKEKFLKIKSKNFAEIDTIVPYRFNYFDTLSWILRKCRSMPKIPVNLSFFQTKKLNQYFDIFGKLYIGYITAAQLKSFIVDFDKEVLDDHVFLTIEKKDNGEFCLAFFVKYVQGGVDRIDLNLETNAAVFSKKDPKGFTSSEVKYMQYILKDEHQINTKTLLAISAKISTWKSY
ncbi:MAG: hypothetical protein U9N30_04360, partial [Campylobacterota bacterium]|nr:hypothetical protein [Campylobacterota bacterium]